jgi:hypothetical protein
MRAMATDPYTLRGIWVPAVTGLFIIAVACGLQAAFAPTVRVMCPARTSGLPDCDLRWLVAFDMVPIRRTLLPQLQSAGEVERMGSGRSTRFGVTPYSVYLHTAAGRVRTILWGDYMELQKFREPIVSYLGDVHASSMEVTMWPSTHPWRMIAGAMVCVGLLCWVWLPVQIVVFLTRRLT